MLKIVLALLINSAIPKFGFSINVNNDLEMIVGIIQSYDNPTAVTAKVCWKDTYKIKLATKLRDLERPVNIRYLRKNETIHMPHKDNHILFLMDMNCADTKYVLNQANKTKLFNKSYRWLTIGNSISNSDAVPNEFKDLHVLVDAEVIVSRKFENNDSVLHKIYKVKPHNHWNVEYYGTWSMKQGLNKSEDTFTSNSIRRKDFKGETITTATVISDNRTKTDILGLNNIYVDTISKSSFRTINSLYDFLNASRRNIWVDTWGNYRNGTWNGMLGQINSNEADLCGTVSFMKEDRMRVVEYLIRPSDITSKFVFRQPPLSYENNLFILPFSSGVWFCLAAFIVILMGILYINTQWDMKKYEEFDEKTKDETCLIPTWSDITIFILSAVSQQGSTNELKGTLGRLVMFFIFLSFVFFYTSYSANIIVLLQSSSNQIRTLSDLLNSKLELGAEDAAHNKYYFSAEYARISDPLRKAIYETKIAPKGKPRFYTLEEGVKLLRTKPFAFNMNTGTGYRMVSMFFTEDEKCGLQEIAYVEFGKPWLCSQRSSPYGEIFKVGYLRLQEHGLNDRESRLVYANKPLCAFKQGSFGSVNMVDFYPLLLMLLYGMISALALLGLEILYHRKQKKNEYLCHSYF